MPTTALPVNTPISFKYQEPGWVEKFNLRVRKTLSIESNKMILCHQTKMTFDLFRVTGISTRYPRLLGLLGLGCLQITRVSKPKTAQDKPDIKTFTLLGSRRSITDFQERLKRHYTTQSLGLLTLISQELAAIEIANKAFTPPDRYIRASRYRPFLADCKRFIQRHHQAVSLLKLSPVVERHRIEQLLKRWESLNRQFTKDDQHRESMNNLWMQRAAQAHEDYFKNIESQALTKEQVEAALSFDDSNLTVAAAGSGKTSVIVAKAGFALKAGYFKDDEMIILAFNKNAANEIRERIKDRVNRELGRTVKIKARTFHSLGLQLWLHQHALNQQGSGPRRPKLVQFNKHPHLLKQHLSECLASNPQFSEDLFEWATYYRYPFPGDNDPAPDTAIPLSTLEKRYHQLCRDYVKSKQREGQSWDISVPTLKPGVFVRSHEEARIYNWLYLREVDFAYEKKCPPTLALKLASKKGADYEVDFTYTPSVPRMEPVYHEHFGLDASGKAPKFLGGQKYEQRAQVKQDILQTLPATELQPTGKRFIQTRSADIRDGSIFLKLEKQLKACGIAVHPENPKRKKEALQAFVHDSDLHALLADFVSQHRDSGLTFNELQDRYELLDPANRERSRRFLKWMQPYCESLDRFMAQQNPPLLDFAAMIRDGTQILKNNPPANFSVKFVMVDEFQDISRARANLVAALLDHAKGDAMLYCVGDDWQAINRFAGSDISEFRALHDFKYSPDAQAVPSSRLALGSVDVRKLSATFRCEQQIANVARSFVMSRQQPNNRHIDKKVVSNRHIPGPTLRIVEHADLPQARLETLHSELDALAKQHAGREPLQVFVLTRNKRSGLPDGLTVDELKALTARYTPAGLDVHWDSMHASKGLGRDHVILVGMDSGKRGFPADHAPMDNLIEALLPVQPDPWEEERRLFYVALTRAKRGVSILCAAERPSMFVKELLESEHQTSITHAALEQIKRVLCPVCKKGWILRQNKFLNCTRYPYCSNTLFDKANVG